MALFGLPDGEGNSWFGQLFVMACYGFILYKAAVLIGDGSEKLLLLYGPGIVGGLVIPILGAVPDGAIVLVSGLGARDEAQCQVSTGVGTLAGSTIMLLTIPWALSLFLGARDLDPIKKTAATKPNGRPKFEDKWFWGLPLPFKSCVTTYSNTVSGAKIMILTAVSYLIVLVPAIIEKNASSQQQIIEEHYPALVGFIVCAVAFIAYSVFQVIDSRQSQDVSLAEMKQQKLKFIAWNKSVGRKIASMDVAIKMAFQKFDKDGNGLIDRKELAAGFKQLGLVLERDEIQKLMKESQLDDDVNTFTEKEFSAAIKKWSQDILKRQNTNYDGAINAFSSIDRVDFDVKNKKQALVTVDDDDDYYNKQNDRGYKNDKSPLMMKRKSKRRSYQSVYQNDEYEEQHIISTETNIEKDNNYGQCGMN